MAREDGVHVDLDELLSYDRRTRQMALAFPRVTQRLLTGNRPSRLHGRGGAFDQIRRYVHGDDVRDIDWNVTARMGGDPFVRVFNEERERPLLVLVDQTQDMFFGTRRQLKSVLAARTAAQLLWLAHHRRQPGGLVLAGEVATRALPPRDHRGHLTRCLAALAQANQALQADARATAAGLRLHEALQRVLGLAVRGALVVLVSDFHHVDGAGWTLVDRLGARCECLALVIHDGIVDRWPDAGRFLATYGGLSAQLRFPEDAGPGGVADRARRHLDRMQERLAGAGVGVSAFSTHAPAPGQLARALGLPEAPA